MITNIPRPELVALRVETNRRLRRASIAHSAVPLMADQPWARRWQRSHRATYAREMRDYRAILAKIARAIGPAPEFFKPRPAVRADAKIARLYVRGIAATGILFGKPKPSPPGYREALYLAITVAIRQSFPRPRRRGRQPAFSPALPAAYRL